MYEIFESSLYYKRIILEADPPEEEFPVDEEIPPEETNEEMPPEETADPLATTGETDPLATGEEQLSPEEVEKNNFQAIQKFILYNKLRELQYTLDDVKTINSYKNKEALIKFNKFLSYVIMFFSIFDYKQASKLTERILTEFKKIK